MLLPLGYKSTVVRHRWSKMSNLAHRVTACAFFEVTDRQQWSSSKPEAVVDLENKDGNKADCTPVTRTEASTRCCQ
jgi:hypothetical protein